jgi:BirA family transcriptional regulator, biotin operon repressor / biotin---[acetyl-CoA-carboxylase] ligase
LPRTALQFDIDTVRIRLPGRRVEWFDSTGSTMTVAAQLARQGCASGTIVGADEQSAGVGRHGRSWLSERSAGLYVSIVLRLPLQAQAVPVVMLALGLATREAIVETTTVVPDLRWPNDVLITAGSGGERKCAGMLAQLEGNAIIAGIGINVNQTGFPENLDTPATSLAMAGAPVTREDLLVALAGALDRRLEILFRDGVPTILRAFTEASSYATARRVSAERDGRRIQGVTCGLDPSGFLKIREDNGMETVILAGGVRPCS